MRSYLIPFVLISSIGAAGMAFAATTTDGTIKALDMKAHTVTLSDGTVYYLPATFKDPGLKVGEKVAVVWTMQGSQHDASEVTIIK